MERTTSFYAEIRQLLANDALTEAIERLQTLLANSPKFNEVVLQSARLSEINRQIRLGMVNDEQARSTRDEIQRGVLELLDEMDRQEAVPAIKAELEAAISIVNSKNVVTGSSIQAGGNVHIGDLHTTTQNADKIYNIDRVDSANFS